MILTCWIVSAVPSGVLDPALVQRDYVGVALHDDRGARGRHGRLRLVEAVEHVRLVEEGRLLRVEVFRLAVADDATAERYALALRIEYREHHAVVEPVVHTAVVALHGDVGLNHLFVLEALRGQVAHEHGAAGREAELPFLGNLPTEPAAAQVGARRIRLGGFPPHELLVVERARLAAYLAQAGFLARRDAVAPAVVDDVDVRAVGEHAHGIGKVDVVHLHDEAEHVAALAAAEAVPELRGGVDLARRRLLVVERAAAPEVATALPHRHALAEQRHEVGCFAYFLDIFIADCHARYNNPKETGDIPHGQR